MQSKRSGILGFCLSVLLLLIHSGDANANAEILRLSEIAWMGTAAGSNDEWIELHNRSAEALELNGWILKSTDDKINIPLAGTVPAGGFFVLERTDDNVISDRTADQLYTGALKNSDIGLQLINPQGTIIDSVEEWHAGDNSTKDTMERNESGDWCTNNGRAQNGLDANSNPIRGTPGAPNSCDIPSGQILINEVMALGSEINPKDDWVELHNPGDEPADLSGWTIEGITLSGAPFVIDGLIIPADGYALLSHYTDSENSALSVAPEVNRPAIEIPDDKPLQIQLRDATGDLVDHMEKSVGSSLNTGTNGTNEYRSLERADGEWEVATKKRNLRPDVIFTWATPKSPNSPLLLVPPEPPPVRLNELLPDPVGKDEEGEFIELWNAGQEDIDLSGWRVGTDSLFALDGYTLEAGGYLVITARESRLTLKNSSDRVVLLDPFGQTVDEMEYDRVEEGASWGRDPEATDQWILLFHPVPGEANIQRNGPPTAVITLQSDTRNMTVNVTGEGSLDPDGDALTFGWTFEPGVQSDRQNPGAYTYSQPGRQTITLTVRDPLGAEHTAALDVMTEEKITESRKQDRGGGEVRGLPSQYLLLKSALPNPEGKDGNREWVTLMNPQSESVDLTGWCLETDKKYCWPAEVILTGENKKIKKSQLGFTLRNEQGALFLSDPSGAPIDQLSWEKAKEGRPVLHPRYRQTSLAMRVTRVIDGDTFKAEWEGAEEAIRLVGVDTPEIDHLSGNSEPYAEEAKAFLKNRIENRSVQIQLEDNPYDAYGRLLGYVYNEGDMINAELIQLGLSPAYTRFSFRQMEWFKALEAEAKANGIGRWGAEKSTLPLQEEEPVTTTAEEKTEEEDLPLVPVSILEPTEEKTEAEASQTPQPSTSEIAEQCFSERLKIQAILPNPQKGQGVEYIRLRNGGGGTVCLAGWQLDDVSDKGSKPYAIKGGRIAPGGVRSFRQTETKIQLNNQNDCARLIDPKGTVQDQICYGKTHKNEVFTHAGGDWEPAPKIKKSATARAPRHRFDRDEIAYLNELPREVSRGELLGVDEKSRVLMIRDRAGQARAFAMAESQWNPKAIGALMEDQGVTVEYRRDEDRNILIAIRPDAAFAQSELKAELPDSRRLPPEVGYGAALLAVLSGLLALRKQVLRKKREP